MNCILPVRYEIKIKFGSQEFAAAQVQGLWQATNKESEGFFYLKQNFPKISEINMKEVFSMVHKINNYSKTMTLEQN
jgi:hypothetical protein